jgi:hypothetical protein
MSELVTWEYCCAQSRRSLLGQHVLHTFWTDCSDIDTYKVQATIQSVSVGCPFVCEDFAHAQDAK